MRARTVLLLAVVLLPTAAAHAVVPAPPPMPSPEEVVLLPRAPHVQPLQPRDASALPSALLSLPALSGGELLVPAPGKEPATALWLVGDTKLLLWGVLPSVGMPVTRPAAQAAAASTFADASSTMTSKASTVPAESLDPQRALGRISLTAPSLTPTPDPGEGGEVRRPSDAYPLRMGASPLGTPTLRTMPPPTLAPGAAPAWSDRSPEGQRSPSAAPPAARVAGTDGDETRADAEGLALVMGSTAAALLLLIPWALYHRMRGERILEHETREKLHALLAASPGINVATVARALSVDPKTARYHLLRLAREGFVVAHGPPRAQRYFLAGAAAPQERTRLVAEREGAALLRLVRDAPGATKSDLASRLDIARPTLAWHLARLERAGLVRSRRDGRHARVYPATEPAI